MTSQQQTGNMLFKIMVLMLVSAGAGMLAAQKLNFGLVPGGIIGLAIFGVGIFALLKLAGAPREMWFTFCLKFFSVTAYKILNATLVLWLAADLGFSKEGAFGFVTGWAIVMSVVTLLVGSVTDAIGVRRTLLLGVSICVISRAVMVVTTDKWLALGCGLFPLAAGEALCTPVLVAALRKFTSAGQRSVAFSLFYAIMNFGFMVAWFIFDGVRESILANGQISLPLVTANLSDYRTLLLVSLVIELCMVPFILMLRNGAEVTDEGFSVAAQTPKYPDAGFLQSIRLTARDGARDTIRLFTGLVQQPGFYRLVAFLLMIGCLKVVFNVMDYVLPTFTMQELGPEVRVGRFNAINGILILVLAPAIGMMTQRFSAYSMVVFGGFVTALSFIFVILPPSLFQGMADGRLGEWIGRGYMELKGAVNPYYLMIVFWQIGFSVGEAFYSPRVYEYAASIAPKGQEASYASLSYIPLLIGKLINGALFGGLLARYCPDTGPRNPGMMWLIIALLVLVAPVGLLLLQRFIRVKEEGRDG